ncbi:MAG: ferric reductase-like transmembrane domain-containing protein [Pseudomonadota bacterium]
MTRARTLLVWGALAVVVCLPILIAAQSPLLAWRDPVYIIAGFAGIVAMAILLLQPLLAGAELPGLRPRQSRAVHRVAGAVLVILVALHVGALWVTSPPDVVDALLFTSPTPFSAWGVIAMWAVFLSAGLAIFRHLGRLAPLTWRWSHRALAAVIVVGSVVHALLIEGTMGEVSKWALCALVVLAALRVLPAPWLARIQRRMRAKG